MIAERCPRPTPVRALPPEEREQVLAVLHEPRFVDLAPAEVYAALLDENRYLCSERTFYRVLEANVEVRERRDQLRHPHYASPELLATRPNELWSYDRRCAVILGSRSRARAAWDPLRVVFRFRT